MRIAARRIVAARIFRKTATGSLRLAKLPSLAAGMTVSNKGIVKVHSICPVNVLPNKTATEERKTMARLVAIAIRVGIWTKEVINGIKMNDPPCPTMPPKIPIVSAEPTAHGRLNVRPSTFGVSGSSFFGKKISTPAASARKAKTPRSSLAGTYLELAPPKKAARKMVLPI